MKICMFCEKKSGWLDKELKKCILFVSCLQKWFIRLVIFLWIYATTTLWFDFWKLQSLSFWKWGWCVTILFIIEIKKEIDIFDVSYMKLLWVWACSGWIHRLIKHIIIWFMCLYFPWYRPLLTILVLRLLGKWFYLWNLIFG